MYRKVLKEHEYFTNWDCESLKTLTEEIKKQVYKKYLVKCEVFQRDNFKCQNLECKSPKSPLTFHHVKWQKNGGEDKVRNGVTLCNTCHKGYHRAKRKLIFANLSSLPSHFRGKTFKLNKPDTINWKVIKKEMKVLRKNLKSERIFLTFEQISMLIKFLMDFEE